MDASHVPDRSDSATNDLSKTVFWDTEANRPFQIAEMDDAFEFILRSAGCDEEAVLRVMFFEKLGRTRNPRGFQDFVENEFAESPAQTLGFAARHRAMQDVLVDVGKLAEPRDAAMREVMLHDLPHDFRAVLLEQSREGFRFDVHGVEDDAVEIEDDRADHGQLVLARPARRFCAASSSMRLRVARA